MTIVAAVIEQGGRLLACRRRADQKHPGKWEFPGGKVEAGEDPVAALTRELEEELGIRPRSVQEMARHPYQYPGGPPLLLIFYRVDGFAGEIENRVFAEVRWVAPRDLARLDFLEGDRDLVRRLADGKLSEP